MRLADFDYDLPADAIASRPADPRDSARMLDLRRHDFADRHVRDLPNLLEAGDLLVVNNTRVMKAQLTGKRGEAAVSVTLIKRVAPDRWECLAKPAKKLRVDDKIIFADDLTATVIGTGEDGVRELRFSCGGDALDTAIENIGAMPLPPYIPRPDGALAEDAENYQTIYARHSGAVAAPTAGLHFTPELMDRLKDAGIDITEVTLHVGAGTFLPVKTDEVRQHRMHSETGEIPHEAAEAIMNAKETGRRVIAIGTTSLRILEACWQEHGKITAQKMETDLFILPGFRFGAVDLLLTNFHLPKSTLLMLVCAFAGEQKIKRAYAHAMEKGYRFFSYGDASLMECAAHD